MMNWYSVESTESIVVESVYVEVIRHGFSPPGERTDTDSLDDTNIYCSQLWTWCYHRRIGKVRGYCF